MYLYFYMKQSLIFIFCLICFCLPASQAHAADLPDADQVNLALRKTMHLLLEMNGDSTSRIESVTQMNDTTWRVKIENSVPYDSLANVIYHVFKGHGILVPFTASLRDCKTDLLSLGFISTDIEQGTVPCRGRELPEGCLYLEVKLKPNLGADQASQAKFSVPWIPLATAGLVAIIIWLFRRKNNKSAALKIESPSEDSGEQFGQSSLFSKELTLVVNGKKHELTFIESRLMELFIHHPNQILDRDFIQKEVWQDEGLTISRTVDVFVSRLRKKLADDASVHIAGIHGIGYRLEVSEEAVAITQK